MDFALLPPEVNSARIYAGPGSAPMLAAAAAWDALAAELEAAARGYSALISGVTGQAWSGPASMTMAAAAAPFVAWLDTTAVQAERTGAQAKAAAAAYEAAFAMTVPPPVIAANRTLLMALIATNFFGQNTSAIAATEAHYAQMWAQDATAMYGYADASSSASALAPFSQPSPTTDPAGQAAQAAAVAHAAGSASGARTVSELTLTLPIASQQLTSALGSSSASTTQTSVLSELGAVLGPASLAGNTGSNTFFLGMNLYTVLAAGLGWGKEIVVSGGVEGYLSNLQALGVLPTLSGLGLPAAGLGKAASLGALSVPPSWATAASGVEPVSLSLSAASIDAVPTLAEGMPQGLTFQQALMATMTGRRAVTEATDRRKAEKDATEPNDDENRATERPVAELVSAAGWLASSAAYNSRRRTDP